MIIVGGAGLLLLGACSPSSYQTTFPEPAYVKVSTNNGAYAPYPDNPIGQQELVYWYDSLTTPMTVVAEVPPTPIVTKGPRVTTNVVLPGRYLVLLPNSDHSKVIRA